MTAKPKMAVPKPLSARGARHSSRTPEWFTPGSYADAARRIMGGIDLDPASCEEANAIIRAKRIFTKTDSGLGREWHGTVFLNPPGGVTDRVTGKRLEPSLVRPFWQQLVHEHEAGRVSQAIWIGYSLEQLQTLQNEIHHPLCYPTCFPRKRIQFESSDGLARSPTHANYVSFLPPHGATGALRIEAFGTMMSHFGWVVTP